MLQIFFLILKIIGIILAAVLGLAILLLLLVLFVPVRYRAYGVKKEGECRAEAKISWLLHLISVPVAFREGELSAKIKILGITLMDLTDSGSFEEAEPVPEPAERTEEQKTAQSGERPAEEAAARSGERPVEETAQSETRQAQEHPVEKQAAPERTSQKKEELEEEEEEKNGIFSRFLQFLRMIWKFFTGIPRKLKNLKCTFRRFCGKIKRMARKYRAAKEFALDERTKAAVRLVLEQAKIFARQALPRKICGEVRFGTSDPALTGQILGIAGIFYPLFMDNVKVDPDFEQTILEGELFLKGRLRIVSAVRIAWRLFRDKNVRYVYRKLNRQ